MPVNADASQKSLCCLWKLAPPAVKTEVTEPKPKMTAKRSGAEPKTAKALAASAKSACKEEPEAQNLTTDDGRYNKFIYRLNACKDAELKAKWAELRKSGDQNAIDEFMEDVMKIKKGVLPQSLQRFKRTIHSHETMDGEEGKWVSWKKASEQEGEAKLLEMVRPGGVKSKRDPRLPKDSAIKWPETLLVALGEQVWSDKRVKRDDDERMEELSDVDGQPDEFGLVVVCQMTHPSPAFLWAMQVWLDRRMLAHSWMKMMHPNMSHPRPKEFASRTCGKHIQHGTELSEMLEPSQTGAS